MTPAQHECELGERAGATLELSAQSGAWRGRLVHRPAVINSASVRAGGAHGCSKCALQPLGTCRTSAARPSGHVPLSWFRTGGVHSVWVICRVTHPSLEPDLL